LLVLAPATWDVFFFAEIHGMFFWDESLCFHGFYSTKSLPGGPHQEADAGAPFHSKLGSVLSQSVDWPLSQLNGLSQVATVGGRLNDCENIKNDHSGGAVGLCGCFPNRKYNMIYYNVK
jgi:hypothetical protein